MRKGLAAVLVFLFFCAPTLGFCGPPRLICAEYTNSSAVVEAKLIESRHFYPTDRDGDDWHIYTLEANKIFRGKVEDEFRVREYNNSGRAGFEWKKGESYLLFLNRNDDGTWWLYGCGNSNNLRKASETIQVVGSLSSHKGGLIQGSISGVPVGPSSLVIRVESKNRGQSFDRKADDNHKFKIHLPAGHYRVVVYLKGWKFKRDSIDSYEDPGDITIENGGCAQVVFNAEQKPATDN